MEALRQTGIIVCLTASSDTILKRTGNSDERPLLKAENPLQKIKKHSTSKPFYEKADIMIEHREQDAPPDSRGDIRES